MKKFLAIVIAITMLLVQLPATVFADSGDVQAALLRLHNLQPSEKSVILGIIWDKAIAELDDPAATTSSAILAEIKTEIAGNTTAQAIWNRNVTTSAIDVDDYISENTVEQMIGVLLANSSAISSLYNSFNSLVQDKTRIKTKLGLAANATDYDVFAKVIEKTGAVLTTNNGHFVPSSDSIGSKLITTFSLSEGLQDDLVDALNTTINAYVNGQLTTLGLKLDYYVSTYSADRNMLVSVLKAYGLYVDPAVIPTSTPYSGGSVVIPTPTPVVQNGTIDGTPQLDSKGDAVLAPTSSNLGKAKDKAPKGEDGVPEVTIKVKEVPGAKQYSVQLPASELTSSKVDVKYEIETPVGTLVVPSTMLAASGLKDAKDVKLSMAVADTSKLSEELKKQIGNRPVIELNVSADGKAIEWNNPDAPVAVSFKYAPTAEELKNPDKIVVWYIDGAGKVVSVPNGKYDAATGLIKFTTTHFSKYAVAYVQKTFTDAGKYKWATNQIEVLASKGILGGVSADKFNPDADITRAEFLASLVDALGLSAKFDTNFVDMKPTDKYYTEIGIAKKLGISGGTTGGRFAPNTTISRQDMMVFIARALKAAGKINTEGTDADISKFTDKAKIAAYAKASISTLVKNKIITGNAGRLNPTGKLSRASAAVALYNLYKM